MNSENIRKQNPELAQRNQIEIDIYFIGKANFIEI